MRIRWLFLLLTLVTLPVRADVVVLVHGYLGDASVWESKGIVKALIQRGWGYGGRLSPGERPPLPVRGERGTLYAVNLPSTAPLMLQSDLLWAMVNKVFEAHPEEAVTLVGHSAGGVVARLALVRFGPGAVDALVTFASPHLGTPRALLGLDVIQDSGPFEVLKEWVGGNTYRRVKGSAPTLMDLSPPRPGNLLYWLNQQDHPAMRYVSVLRLPDRDGGDDLVPVPSQDLNQVPVLRGKSEVLPTAGAHDLRPDDARIIAGLLE